MVDILLWWCAVTDTQLLHILSLSDILCANVQYLLPVLGADIQWEDPSCSYGSLVNQRGSSRMGWETWGDDRSSFDRGVVPQWKPGCALTEGVTVNYLTQQAPSDCLCLAFPLMWASLSLFSLSLSLSHLITPPSLSLCVWVGEKDRQIALMSDRQ